MPELLVKTVRELPNGNILFEKRLYFLTESDIIELRKKTNWVKGDKGRFAGSVPMGGGGNYTENGIVYDPDGNPFVYPELRLPKDEYARVVHG